MSEVLVEVDELAEVEAYIAREEAILGGVESFWKFCQLRDSDFYRDDRPHLRTLCETLQAIWERRLLKPDGTPYRKLMINMPPQHGKSRTLTAFCQWVFGKNVEERIVLCSYNDDMAGDFSKYTRDGIAEVRQAVDGYVFSDFFPNTKVKYGSGSYFKWALEGQHFSYLGAGVLGGITGKGGTVRIIDDPVRDAAEAFNENALDTLWMWYAGTFLSRSDAKTGGSPLDILLMTRWAAKDPCGRIMESADAPNWYVLKMPVCNEETGEMLCESILSREAYETLKILQPPEIFFANYQQETVETRGLLYPTHKVYEKLPVDENGKSVLEGIRNYTDTADMGNDYLVSINYGVYRGEAYVLDVLYTKAGMEVTEPLTARMLFEGNVGRAKIESNNGGRGFARSVERLLWENHQSRKCRVVWFHQSENKRARIMTAAHYVQDHVYFPINWRDRWPEFHRAVTTYLKEAKNKHDDAPDCLTGIAEDVIGSGGFYDPSKRTV